MFESNNQKLIWWYYKREPGISTDFPQHTWVYGVCVSMCAKSLQSCPAFCNSMDCSPPGSSVHEIFQAVILEWVAISSSRVSSRFRDQTCVSCLGRHILYHWAIWEAHMTLCVCQNSGNCTIRRMHWSVCEYLNKKGIPVQRSQWWRKNQVTMSWISALR